MSCGAGRGRGSDLKWLWLWHSPAATVPFGPPYAKGAALKDKKKKKKEIFLFVFGCPVTDRAPPPGVGSELQEQPKLQL